MLDFEVEHEEWWFAFKSFQNQFRDQIHSWQRDRSDLLFKIRAVFSEANAANEAEKERSADREKQDKICKELHEKVLQSLFTNMLIQMFIIK